MQHVLTAACSAPLKPSGHLMYSPADHSQIVFMSFVWIWEQTAIISLYSINWLVFITETECVYCAVGPWLSKARVLLQVSLVVIKSHWGSFAFKYFRALLLSFHPLIGTDLHLRVPRTRTSGQSLVNFQDECFLGKREGGGGLDRSVCC
jgi:hypothetical protein